MEREGAPRGTILLADNDPAVRSLAQEILSQSGYRVLVAADGQEALRIAVEYPDPIHLLSTDLIMRGLNGAELGRRLRLLRPEIRVLYVTACAVAQLGHQDIVRKPIVLEPGVPILVKPFSVEALGQTVREVLDQSPPQGVSPPPGPPVKLGTGRGTPKGE